MRTISSAMLGYLHANVRTLNTCWAVTRTDGNVFFFTDRDAPILYSGNLYQPAGGFSASALSTNSNLSVANMEANALFDGSVKQHDIQAGVWDLATIVIFLVNANDVGAGQVTLTGGTFGEFKLANGKYTVELRSLAQVMQQGYGQFYSPTCRATFGDSRCLISGGLGPLTFTGTVGTVTSAQLAWDDSSLTQTGPTVPYIDTQGVLVPDNSPWQIQIIPPDGGSFAANTSVLLDNGNALTEVGGSPGPLQYSVTSGGLYTFNSQQNANQVHINYTYGIGYFAYGVVKWLTGLNAGEQMEVKAFSPGLVTLVMPMIYPINPGDTYTIVAGCDKQFGTCKTRWNNIVHFRGEPFVPGTDTILAVNVKS